MIKLYYAPPSIYGRKVLAVLHEKDLDYTIIPMSFTEKEYKKPEYLKLNPNGEVPTLVDEDDVVVYESTAMIEYLNDEYPEPPLLPEDSGERAKSRMVDLFCNNHLYRSIIKCVIKIVFKNEEVSEEEKAALAKDIQRLEQYLGSNHFIAGKTFTLADCTVMAAIATIEKLGFGEMLNTSTALKNYVVRMKAREGYKGASLYEIPQTTTNA
jgi:glutathione S-transferase